MLSDADSSLIQIALEKDQTIDHCPYYPWRGVLQTDDRFFSIGFQEFHEF